MTLDAINALSKQDFVGAFGFLFEYSPWVVEQAAARRPFADRAAMEAAMRDVVNEAGEDAWIALLRAHPELAGKAAIDGDLTDASAAEQASAGLDRMTPEEFAHFHDLNNNYRTRHGFPFIICVRQTDRAGILAAMARRLDNDRPTELAAALAEVGKIVHLRLTDALADASVDAPA